jgi:hypothetical protein
VRNVGTRTPRLPPMPQPGMLQSVSFDGGRFRRECCASGVCCRVCRVQMHAALHCLMVGSILLYLRIEIVVSGGDLSLIAESRLFLG